MHPDRLIFSIATLFAVISAALSLYLFFSKKKNKIYEGILHAETQVHETFVSTVFTNYTDEDQKTEFVDDEVPIEKEESTFRGLDCSALEGKYVLKWEIKGGGMSRVFLAQNTKIGNDWIIKYIPTKYIGSDLGNEVNILRELNHINLPSIVDIFNDSRGVFVVESYIEGISLSDVMATQGAINQVMVLDWAIQMVQVLAYLHNRKPSPIYHFDLKPSNLILTHDNKLVLIDFGISRRAAEEETNIKALTYRYAAPEQLKRSIPDKYKPMIEQRFGKLPEERMNWKMDARTDIYSLGVILFELLTGASPTLGNIRKIEHLTSPDFCNFIRKCLQVDPRKRFQSVNQMFDTLTNIKNQRIKMVKSLFMRKLAIIAVALLALMSLVGFVIGLHEWGRVVK